MTTKDPAVAAIEYALIQGNDGIEFLRCWMYGNFKAIRENWPDAPEAVFIGADQFHSETESINLAAK